MNIPIKTQRYKTESPLKITGIYPSNLEYLNAFSIHYTNKVGHHKVWELVSRGDIDRVKSEVFDGQSFSDGAMIVAVDKNKETIVLIREYRVSQGRFVVSLPAGLCDPGESIADSAIREFKEETGMGLEISHIEVPRYASVGMIDEKITLVYGHYTGTPNADHLSDQEDIEVIIANKALAISLLENEEVPIRTALILEHYFGLNAFFK